MSELDYEKEARKQLLTFIEYGGPLMLETFEELLKYKRRWETLKEDLRLNLETFGDVAEVRLLMESMEHE